MRSGSIVVLGSINYDYLLTQDRLPRRGETYAARAMDGAFGGKGANQAIQAARLGADVDFLGSVGDDDNGRKSAANLDTHGIVTTLRPSTLGTGAGFVHITGPGDVYATIYVGANGVIDAEWVTAQADRIAAAEILIVQNEIPAEANARAITVAHEAGTRVIYNAAPAREVSRSVSGLCTWFVVNEDEAEYYLGRSLGDPSDEVGMKQAAAELRAYCPGVILTLGRHGSVLATGESVDFIAARPVRAVDTTGAGDSFVGAFAVALLEGSDSLTAAGAATVVASFTVLGVGAQLSMPMREDIPHEAVFASSVDS